MRDPATQRSRGFGFLSFEDPEHAEEALKVEHFLDGKMVSHSWIACDFSRRLIHAAQVDVKKAQRGASAISSSANEQRSEKIFVGGVHPEVSEDEFRDYFATFGPVGYIYALACFEHNLLLAV